MLKNLLIFTYFFLYKTIINYQGFVESSLTVHLSESDRKSHRIISMKKNKRQTTQSIKKLVIVGDSDCARTLELPTVTIPIDQKTIHLTLVDVSGTEHLHDLRSLIYNETHIILICFSVDSPASAGNVLNKWVPEIRIQCNRCPIILVACKVDLRTDARTIATLSTRDEAPVTTEKGQQIAAEIKANAYMECSAKTHEGVQDLLLEAARLLSKQHSHRTVKCRCILQ
ncbi:unnamed protein product [Rotaria magnacalcarata]